MARTFGYSVREFFGMAQPGVRCPEARLLATDFDYVLARDTFLAGTTQLAAITAGFQSDRPTEQIAAAVELRKLMAQQLSGPALRRLLNQLQSRYRIAAGPAAAVRYESNAPDYERAPDAVLLAETHALLERLKVIYVVGHLRDELIQGVRRLSLGIVIVLLLSLVVLRFVPALLGDTTTAAQWDATLNYFQIALAGALGALVSIMRRSQHVSASEPLEIDPVRQISELRFGRTGLWIAGFLGPVMALVLLALFASRALVIEGLSPDFLPLCGDPPSPPTADGTPTCSSTGAPFEIFGHSVVLASASDAAKMMVWAFLAGFAEKLVPDVLDRFVRRSKEQDTAFRSRPVPPTPPDPATETIGAAEPAAPAAPAVPADPEPPQPDAPAAAPAAAVPRAAKRPAAKRAAAKRTTRRPPPPRRR